MRRLSFKLFIFMITGFALLACNQNKDKKETMQQRDSFEPISKNFDDSWAQSKYWDDGKAEVSVYDAQRVVYDKSRNFEYTYVTVSEEFNKKFRVKTDDYDREDLYKIIKVNAIAQIKTDIYPYHYLTSLYFLRDKPLMLDKLTNSSQEWCGNTFKEFLRQDNEIELHYNSYFDGEGDGDTTIADNVLLEDQLNYSLRSLKFANHQQFKAKVLATQVNNKVGNLPIYNAVFTVSDGGADLFGKASWKVSVKLDQDKTNTYYFEKAYPNVLLKENAWDGRSLVLKNTSRYAYWKH